MANNTQTKQKMKHENQKYNPPRKAEGHQSIESKDRKAAPKKTTEKKSQKKDAGSNIKNNPKQSVEHENNHRRQRINQKENQQANAQDLRKNTEQHIQTNENKKSQKESSKESRNNHDSLENENRDKNNNEVKFKEQSGKFETAFNRIHKVLKEMVNETDSDAFVELLYSGYKKHSLIRKYKNELHQFAKLRNAIVHERVDEDYYIAEPHIEVIERIEEIARDFEKPQTALSIATSPVFYYYEDAYLKDVLKVINKFDFTRFPIYDQEDKYIGLLTSTEIIQWMAKHFSDKVVHFEDVRVKDLLTNKKNYFVIFIPETAALYEIEELFERYHTRGKKLQAVIITETGDRHGIPKGVITPWDLLDSDPSDD